VVKNAKKIAGRLNLMLIGLFCLLYETVSYAIYMHSGNINKLSKLKLQLTSHLLEYPDF